MGRPSLTVLPSDFSWLFECLSADRAVSEPTNSGAIGQKGLNTVCGRQTCELAGHASRFSLSAGTDERTTRATAKIRSCVDTSEYS